VARLWLSTGVPVIPIAMWGPHEIFDPRTKKLRLRPRTPVTVVAGPPIDLSKWAGAAPTTPILNEITEAIMLQVRDMLAEIRGGTPPSLYLPTRARAASTEGSAEGSVEGSVEGSAEGGAS
jgi:1-acyl-sn-glycerol-3-phosphate acyltransferase